MVWANRKLVGYGLAVLAFAIFAMRVHAWRTGYLERDQAVLSLKKEQQARQADAKTYTANIAIAEKEAQALASDLAAIRAKFANLPPVVPKTLIRTVEVPRDPAKETCPDPRLSPEFIRLWNDAGNP